MSANNRSSVKSSKNSQTNGTAKVSAPVASSKKPKSSPKPNVQNLRKNGIQVSHREYLSEISGSVTFTSEQYPINPGLGSTFPWLSSIARRYESYNFKRLHFSFETESPTSTPGAVMHAVDYDASDSAPTNKVSLMSYEGSVRSAPWVDSTFSALSSSLHKSKTYYIRSGALNANQDIKMYDVGNYFIATQGQTGTAVLGELYVEYVVDLFTPQLDSNVPSCSITGATGISIPLPFGTAPIISGPSPATIVANGVVFSQPGEFLMTWIQGNGNGSNFTFSADMQSALISFTLTGVGVETVIYRVRAYRNSMITIVPTVVAPVNPVLRLSSYVYDNA